MKRVESCEENVVVALVVALLLAFALAPHCTADRPSDGALAVGQSERDGSGRFSIWVEFPEQPVAVRGGDEAFVYRRTFLAQIPRGSVLAIWSFIGTDAGDRFESDVEIVTREGIRLYQRSLHHFGAQDYDAWNREPSAYTCDDPGGCYLEIVLLGRITGRNISEENPNFGALAGRFHFGLRMMMKE